MRTGRDEGLAWRRGFAAMSLRAMHGLNVVLAALVAMAFWYAYTRAFANSFSCEALIVDRYGLPTSVCEGAIGTGGVIGDAMDAVGVGDGETVVPGLDSLIDPPLAMLRKVGIAFYLTFLVVLSVVVTAVVATVPFLARLVRRDRAAWRRLAGLVRTFLLIVLALYGASAAAVAVLG